MAKESVFNQIGEIKAPDPWTDLTWVGGKSAGSAIGSAPMCVFACVTIACARTATTQTELRPKVVRAMIMMQKSTLQPLVRLSLRLMSTTTNETTLKSAYRCERTSELRGIQAESDGTRHDCAIVFFVL